MNRKVRRALKREHNTAVSAFPARLTLIPDEEMPPYPPLLKAWRSRRYLVQLYDDGHMQPGLLRLSICRPQIKNDDRWADGITWDELQAIKREVGYGDWYAVEVYPRDRDLINVANFRHLWLLPVPLQIGWFSGGNQ